MSSQRQGAAAAVATLSIGIGGGFFPGFGGSRSPRRRWPGLIGSCLIGVASLAWAAAWQYLQPGIRASAFRADAATGCQVRLLQDRPGVPGRVPPPPPPPPRGSCSKSQSRGAFRRPPPGHPPGLHTRRRLFLQARARLLLSL